MAANKRAAADAADTGTPCAPERFMLALFVVGTTPSSARAIVNVRRLCEQHLGGRYELEVIDLSLDPKAAAQHQVVAAPTLLKRWPPPVRRFIGDMSNAASILRDLGVRDEVAPSPN